MAFWLAHGTTLALLAQETAAPATPTVADLAREKDIVWLSLVTAITAISFSAWLVRQMINLQAKSLETLEQLKIELAKRPCMTESK